jgi:CubicO group peptidase (beta-lactamase class C family)
VHEAVTPEALARLDEAVARALIEYNAPSLSVAVVSGSDLVYARALGLADIEAGRAHDLALRHRIGSITKTMVGVMALVESRKLSLDTALADIVPEIRFDGMSTPITLRHLLSHTSGIGEGVRDDGANDFYAGMWSATSVDGDVLPLFAQGVTLETAPGTAWCYANHGYALLGEVLQRVEHAPLADILARRIFMPLGMNDTDISDLPNDRLTAPYARDGDQTTGANKRGEYAYLRARAAGAVQSTIADMAKYAVALLSEGGGIVSRETFRAMTAPVWAPDPRLEGWGLSFLRTQRFGRFMFGHGGTMFGGWRSSLLVVPAEAVALIVHANSEFDAFDRIVSRLLAALFDAPHHSATRAGTSALEPMRFAHSGGPLTRARADYGFGEVAITHRDGGLHLQSTNGKWRNGHSLIATSDPLFFHVDDDPIEPSAIKLIGAPANVTGLHCNRLIHLSRL